MTLDRFPLNRVNSCNKSFWAQNLYYLKSMRTFFISKLKEVNGQTGEIPILVRKKKVTNGGKR